MFLVSSNTVKMSVIHHHHTSIEQYRVYSINNKHKYACIHFRGSVMASPIPNIHRYLAASVGIEIRYTRWTFDNNTGSDASGQRRAASVYFRFACRAGFAACVIAKCKQLQLLHTQIYRLERLPTAARDYYFHYTAALILADNGIESMWGKLILDAVKIITNSDLE